MLTNAVFIIIIFSFFWVLINVYRGNCGKFDRDNRVVIFYYRPSLLKCVANTTEIDQPVSSRPLTVLAALSRTQAEICAVEIDQSAAALVSLSAICCPV